MLHSLDHVALAVRDLDAAIRDSRALLGRAPAWRGVHSGQGIESAIFPLSNTSLELLSPAGPGDLAEAVRGFLEARGEGVLALAFGTDDAVACAAALRARGLPAADPVAGEGVDASGARRRWRHVLLPASATRGTQILAVERCEGALPASAPDEAPEASVAGLDHVVVASSDLAAARGLYADGLGLRLALDREFPARGLRMLFFRVGGVTLEVVGRLHEPPAPESEDHFGGLAWQVPDVAAGRARLEAAGFDVSGVRDGFKPGTRVCSVRDRSCGVPTLLIQPAPRLSTPAQGR